MTREEAIEEIKRWTPILLNSGQCTEKTSDAQDIAISALSADGEYIKKEDAIRHFQSFEKIMKSMPLVDVKARLKDLPTYSFPDSAENKGEDRPKGHWIDREVYDADRWKCSECGRTEQYKENFCSDCGADMREPKGEKAKDFPQAEDIAPTIESFKKVLDNRLIREALDEPKGEKGTE